MSQPDPPSPEKPGDDFARQAAEPQVGLVREFLEFLVYNASWWIAPIFVVLLGLGVLVWLTGSSVAPFIYTLF